MVEHPLLRAFSSENVEALMKRTASARLMRVFVWLTIFFVILLAGGGYWYWTNFQDRPGVLKKAATINDQTVEGVVGPVRPVGVLDIANPVGLCYGQAAASVQIKANASVEAEVRVYQVEGVDDGTVILTVPANQVVEHSTGAYVREQTLFVLVGQLSQGGELELDRVVVQVERKECLAAGNAPKLSFAAVYNSATLPKEYKSLVSEVRCGELVAVWQVAEDSGPVEGFRIINQDSFARQVVEDPRASFWRFNPALLSGSQNPGGVFSYAVAAFTGTNESRLPAGQVAAVSPCAPDLKQSNLDLVQVNEVSTFTQSNVRNLYSDVNLANAGQVKVGDTLKFRLHVINTGSASYKEQLSVRLALRDLESPEGDWGVRFLCGEEQLVCQNWQASVMSFSKATNVLNLTLSPMNGAELSVGSVWSVEFSGKITGNSVQVEAFVNGSSSSALRTVAVSVSN